MAPAKNTRSQSSAARDNKAGGEVATLKSEIHDDTTQVTTAQSNSNNASIEKWLGKVDNGVDPRNDSSTKKARRATKQSAPTTTKTQKRLSSYVSVSKSTSKDGKPKEETRETTTATAVKVTTVSPDRKVTRERREIITDTTVIMTKGAEAGKKRKRGEDDDADYIPPGAGSEPRGLTESEGEDFDEWTTKRPRRNVRDSILYTSYRISHDSLGDSEDGSPKFTGTKAARPSPRKRRLAGKGVRKEFVVTLKVGRLAEVITSFLSTGSITVTETHPIALPDPVRKRSSIPKPVDGWDNAAYGFSFDYTPYRDHQAPTHADATKVFNTLRDDLASHGITVGPGERGTSAGVVTVDAIVRTILAQATSNENALFVQDLLRKKFTYTVGGKEVQGRTPNYHNVRLCSEAEIAKVILPGGLHNTRSVFIKAILNTVYEANTVGCQDWDGVDALNAAEAPDFVPGLLSLDFLKNLSKVGLFNWLCAQVGVGVKTAHCIMEFNYRLPICAVDTHVFFMAVALGWLPIGCEKPDHAAMHLDARLPDALKHDLHQAFWNHRQHCGPCKKFNGEKSKATDTGKCVLEDRLKRRDTRGYKHKRGGMKVSVKKTKTQKTIRKSHMVQLKDMDATKAAELGYVMHDLGINDDFDAGSVNRKTKAVWMLNDE